MASEITQRKQEEMIKAAAQTPKGALPKYLQQRRKQEEEEKKLERQEIELNKRPPGTKILVEKERQELMSNL